MSADCKRTLRGFLPDRTTEPQLASRQPLARGLTSREQQVAKLVRVGLSNKDIAKTLGLTEGSIKQHVHVIFRKLGIKRRMGLRDFPESLFIKRNEEAVGSRESAEDTTSSNEPASPT